MTNELTKSEMSRRTALERTIKQTKGAFVACGIALAEIRDSKLYRSTHKTFEAYCSDVWGWSRPRAYRLIAAAEIKDKLKMSPIGDKITSEGQVRALADVPEDKRAEVLEDAASRGEVTAKQIKESAEKIAAKDELVDSVGRIVPKELREDWIDATRVGKEIRSIGLHWKKTVDNYLSCGDRFRQRHNLSYAMSKDIGQLAYELSCTIPYAVCPYCQGLAEKCANCHSRGWVSKSYWTSFVPEKLKKIIQTPTLGTNIPKH